MALLSLIIFSELDHGFMPHGSLSTPAQAPKTKADNHLAAQAVQCPVGLISRDRKALSQLKLTV